MYLHRGVSYVVDALDLDEQLALVHEERPEWTTTARSVSSVDLLEVEAERVAGRRDPLRILPGAGAPSR